jgi:hypothetical protein
LLLIDLLLIANKIFQYSGGWGNSFGVVLPKVLVDEARAHTLEVEGQNLFSSSLIEIFSCYRSIQPFSLKKTVNKKICGVYTPFDLLWQ